MTSSASTSTGSAVPTPHASLVIPVYRGWSYVYELLEPLMTAVVEELEVVVVDDHSADGGAAEFARRVPDARLIERTRNGGFAAAVNTGVRAARGSVIVLANSDLQMTRAALEELIRTARKHPRSVVGPRTVRPDGSVIDTAHHFPTLQGDTAELFVLARVGRWVTRRLRSWVGSQAPVPFSCDWVVGSCLAFTRDVWAAVGEMDESFGMYSEEVDWQKRAHREGIRALYVPSITVRHDESHGLHRNDEASERRFLAIWRSRHRYFETHHGTGSARTLRYLWSVAYHLNVPLWRAISVVAVSLKKSAVEIRKLDHLRRMASDQSRSHFGSPG